jgi:hypothetical protein
MELAVSYKIVGVSCVSGHFIFIETNQGIAAQAGIATAKGATLVRNSAQPPSKVILWVYRVAFDTFGGCELSLASLEAVPGVVACTVPRTSRGAGSGIRIFCIIMIKTGIVLAIIL